MEHLKKLKVIPHFISTKRSAKKRVSLARDAEHEPHKRSPLWSEINGFSRSHLAFK